MGSSRVRKLFVSFFPCTDDCTRLIFPYSFHGTLELLVVLMSTLEGSLYLTDGFFIEVYIHTLLVE
jgi:hypothetical protein